MPFPIATTRLRRLLSLSAAALLVSCVAPALAAACTRDTAPTSQVFAKYGDYSQYQLTPNGMFAGASTAGWTFTGAGLASSAGGAGLVSGDTYSAYIPSGGEVVSPTICIDTTTPTIRFMLRNSLGPWATMMVDVLWTDWAGNLNSTYIGWVGGSTSWAPSAPLNVSALPLWESGESLSIRLVLVPSAGSGSWLATDFFLDPYSRG
jgi:hypothetical protein